MSALRDLRRLMLPLQWRWRWMAPGERQAQLALDAMANVVRYGAADQSAPVARDPHADTAIHRYLVGSYARQLEIGGGVGTYTAMPSNLSGAPPRAYSTNEPSDARWQDLHARHPTVERIGGDAYALEAAADTFDVVTVLHVLHHLADRARAMAEWQRVLVPGGRLLIVEPRHTWRRAARLAYHWAVDYRKTEDPLRYATHDFCTRAEVRRLCQHVGLVLVALPRVRGRVVAVADKPDAYAHEWEPVHG